MFGRVLSDANMFISLFLVHGRFDPDGTFIDPDGAFRICVQFSQVTAMHDDGQAIDVSQKYDKWEMDYRYYTLEML